MEIKSQHRHVSRAFRTLIIFFKLIGFATFTHNFIEEKRNASTLYIFKYSKLGIVYNVILVILKIASNYVTIPRIIKVSFGKSTNITICFMFMEAVYGTLVTCMILLSYCVNQKTLVRIMNRLTDVERDLDHLYRLHPSLQRQCIMRFLIVICILEGCFMLIVFITEYISFPDNPILWTIDMVPIFHVGWYMIQYSFLVITIQADFTDVNRAIQKLSDIAIFDLQSQAVYEIRHVVISDTTIPPLQQLRNIHRNLCDISEDVSNFYSVPILFCFALIFGLLVYYGYYFILPLLLTEELLEVAIFVNTAFMIILLICPVFLLTTRITKVTSEVG